jgi:patatin-like phospholipase/acyl hydrolase
MPSYHILSLDGGGIRGLLTVILLERLEEAHLKELAMQTDLTGTIAWLGKYF